MNTGTQPQSGAIGDFNGDGNQDLAVASYNTNTVSIRLGDGLGGFSGSTAVSVGSLPTSVAIGDFNGDGKQDLATANENSATVSIRLGDGLGGFTGSTNISVGAGPYSVAIGDFNGNGMQDFAVANRFSNTVSIRLGDGAGGFTGSTEVGVGASPRSVAIGDFNGDGKQDLAVANINSDTVSIRQGDGSGGFSGSTDVSVAGDRPLSVAIGDFNGDGMQDLAVANLFSGTVSIGLGDGSGGFSGVTDIGVGSSPDWVAVGDFNNDGKQDLAVANEASNTVSIRLGSCVAPTPTSTSTNTPTNTNTATATSTNTNTPTSTSTNTATATDTPTNTPTPTPTCLPIPADAISWWKGEDNANDVYGVNHGTPSSGVTFSPGKVGQAFDLGPGDSQVVVPHNPNLDITTSFTGEAWIYPRSFQNLYPRIFQKDDGDHGWLFIISNAGGNANTLGVALRGLDSPDGFYTNENTISLNQWSHVAFTYDGNTIKLFINGVESGSLAVTGQPFTNSGPLRIGQDGSGTRQFDGLIDEPTVYQRALSDAEILAIYNAGSAGKCDPVSTPTNTATDTPTATNTATFTPTPVGYAVLYDGNGNTAGSAPADPNSPYLNGSTVVVLEPGSLVNAGYQFDSWNTAANGSGIRYTPAQGFIINSSTTLYAQWSPQCFPAGGSLDPTFDGDGKVTTDFLNNSHDQAHAIAIQSDGKIVAAGRKHNGSNYDFAVARYNTDGSLDTNFGTGGKVVTPILSLGDEARSVAIQTDGKIVVAGHSQNGTIYNHDFAVVRYHTDGTLDDTFHDDGMVTTPILSGSDQATAVMIQPDGMIVATGSSRNGPNPVFALARYDTLGELDPNFHFDGIVTAPVLGTGGDASYSAVLQSDGRIVMSGHANVGLNSDFGLIRFNTNGTVDTGFGNGGTVLTPFFGSNELAHAVTIQPWDQRIVAAGHAPNGQHQYSNHDIAIARYNTNGSLDTPNFDVDGKVVTDIAGNHNYAYSVAVQPDGKIVTAGWGYVVPPGSDFALTRYNANGSLDNTFDGDGKITTAVFSATDQANAVAIQPDGKIVAAGWSVGNITSADFALVRYGVPCLSPSQNVGFAQTQVLTGQAASAQTGSAATSGDPTVTSVIIPPGAAPSDFTLTITETNGANAPSGFSAFGQTVHIDGGGVTLNSSATVTFRFDSSITNGASPQSVQIFRNSVAVPDCAGDPCVVSRSSDSGDIVIVVSTTQFSDWVAAAQVPSTVSGAVTYGNSLPPGPELRYVPDVLVSAAGSPALSDITSSVGNYLLTGFGAGSYTITPAKSGGQNNSITAFDAGKIAQYMTGGSSFTAAQAAVADVSGAGGISSFDAALIARYVASLGSPTGSSGTWIFNPASNTHLSIATDITGEDYAAYLMGDVSGNWEDDLSPFRPAIGGVAETSGAVELPQMTASTDKEIIIPVSVQGVADKGIIAYEFDLRYDPTVIQPQANPVDLAGTASRGLVAVVNAEQRGLLRVVVYGAMPIDENGVLLNLRFTAVGKPGSVSPLIFERFMFNEGLPVTAIDGLISVDN